jgi:lipase chaperone LimK
VKSSRPALIAAVLVTTAGAWWLGYPVPASDLDRSNTAVPSFALLELTAEAVEGAIDAATPGPIADSFLTPDLRYRIGDLLLAANPQGEHLSSEALKARVEAVVATRFPPVETARARVLLGRYIDYQSALSAQAEPGPDVDDPRSLRKVFEARRQVRQQHFMPDEYEALFGRDDEVDLHNLARMEIEANAGLTPEQRNAALEENERSLGEPERALRAANHVPSQISAQNDAFEASGASDQERFAQRSATYGIETAQRLGQVDRDERDWRGRLTQYADAQAALRAGGIDTQSLDRLKAKLFTPTEQLRLDAALQLRDLASSTALPRQ